MIKASPLFLLVIAILLVNPEMRAEDPFGKDAPLVKRAQKKQQSFSCSPALYLISFHQQIISEADGPRSHFVPSSSEYMRQAILQWGAGTGFILGCDRLLRENNEEWIYRKRKLRCGYLKWNPIPLPSQKQG
jgi:uncharacterized protein